MIKRVGDVVYILLITGKEEWGDYPGLSKWIQCNQSSEKGKRVEGSWSESYSVGNS